MGTTYYKSTTAGNWSSTNSWATAADGTTGVPCGPPTAADDVLFNANGANCTIDTTTCVAKSVDFTGYTGTLTHTAAMKLTVSGSITFVAGMTYTLGNAMTSAITVNGAGTLTTAGKTLGNLVLSASGSTITIADDLTLSGTIRRIAGTIDFTTNTTTVTLSGSYQVYPQVTPIQGDFTGTSSFYKLTHNSSAPPAGWGNVIEISGNITTANALTINGFSASSRTLIRSSVQGTQRTITADSLVTSNTDWQDIIGAGAASWDLSAVAGYSGNCGGCTGITFTDPLILYWYTAGAGSYNYSNAAYWFTEAALPRTTSVRPPLPQDTCYVDQYSIGASGITITQDLHRIPATYFTGVTNNPTFAITASTSYYGDLLFVDAMTVTMALSMVFEGRGNYTYTIAGKTFDRPTDIKMPGGSLKIVGNWVITNILWIYSGALDMNGYDVTVPILRNDGALYPRSGTLTITAANGDSGMSTPLNCNSGRIQNDSGSTIKLTNTTATTKTIYWPTAGDTIGTVWLSGGSGAGSYNFINSVTMDGTFKDDGTAAHSILFTAGTTTTAASWQISGAPGAVRTIGSITAAGHTLAKSGGGSVKVNFCSVSYSTASPAGAFFADKNSTDGGHNSGWVFLTSSGIQPPAL